MDDVIIGNTLVRDPAELNELVKRVRSGSLRAARVDRQDDGDIRYWDVAPSDSPVLEGLLAFGRARFFEAVGKAPAAATVMINDIDAARSPGGSGGGWHRDSYGRQYKAFVYLTDVSSESQGAFAYIPASNRWPLRLVSLVHRLATGANRYTDRTIRRFPFLGIRAVLLQPGIPFFVNTSLVHRGLPITEGHRVMATLYLFDREPGPQPSRSPL